MTTSLAQISTTKLHRFNDILNKANTPPYRKDIGGRYWLELNPIEKAIRNELERRRGVPACQKTWPE